jgi:hypothetical protein
MQASLINKNQNINF